MPVLQLSLFKMTTDLYVLRFFFCLFFFWTMKNRKSLVFHNDADEQKQLKIAKDLSFQYFCNVEATLLALLNSNNFLL